MTTTASNVKATGWPHTAIVAFSPPTSTDGREISGYQVAGTNGGNFVIGSGTKSPVLVQGKDGVWNPSTPYSFNVTTQYTDGTSTTASAASNAVMQTGGAGPSTSPLVYADGIFYWEGDFDFGGSATYTDTAGDPEGDSAGPGPMDVAWTAGATGGCWYPYAPTGYYDTTPYNYLQFDVKATTANKTYRVYFMKYGDVAISAYAMAPSDSQGTYGPASVVGEWITYKIPLKNMDVGPQSSNPQILKFGICDGTQTTNTVFYINNVKFVTE